MYSIVLMAAVTMGPDTASFGKRGGCCGGGCYGGGCSGSCYGGGCYGGGGCHGRRGCHGGCHGGGYGGGYGGCCGGGWGGCYGGGYGGCYGGGYGGCWGGGYGGCCGGYGGGYGGYVVPTAPMTPMQVTPKTGASLKFQMPADAKLYVDNQLTTSTGTERAFVTPALTPGQKYYYDVKAELVVAGQTVTEERRVIVESGAEVITTFPKLTAAMTTRPAGVASK